MPESKVAEMFDERIRLYDEEVEEVSDSETGGLEVGDIGDLWEWYKSRTDGLRMLRHDVMKEVERDRRALWAIWDVLQMWRDDDHQWSSDEIEMVANVMMSWVGHDRHTLTPVQYRENDEDCYEETMDLAPEDDSAHDAVVNNEVVQGQPSPYDMADDQEG